MKTFKRICIKDWEITAENGDYFEVKRGKEYITSKEVNGEVKVFGQYWVWVPSENFAGAVPFT